MTRRRTPKLYAVRAADGTWLRAPHGGIKRFTKAEAEATARSLGEAWKAKRVGY